MSTRQYRVNKFVLLSYVALLCEYVPVLEGVKGKARLLRVKRACMFMSFEIRGLYIYIYMYV